MLLAWFLRLLLVFLIVRAVWRFLVGIAQGMGAPRVPRRGGDPVALVRDPVCGTYVVPSRALTLGRGDSAQYFCSERCRDQYRAGRAMPA